MKKLKHTSLLLPAGYLLSACTSVGLNSEDQQLATDHEQLPATSPNILVIVTDDQNKDTVGCYDNSVSTPNIDRIAQGGIKFNNANVVTTVSSPSRYSLLTGRYYNSNYSSEFLSSYPAGTVSCTGNNIYMESDGNNMAGILQASGYTTGFVGKFHNTCHTEFNAVGSWESYGLMTYDSASDPRVDSLTNVAMQYNHNWWCEKIEPFGFDYVNGVYCANLRELYNDVSNTHNVEWTMDSALKFLEQQEDSSDPFFLWVATTYAHGPTPEKYSNGEFPNSIDADPTLTGEGVREDLDGTFPDRAAIKAQWESSGLDTPAATALWWDAAVGALLDKLESMGVADNTIILYISDHGYINNAKSTLYEDGTCVPMLMQWKNGMLQGVEYDNLIGSIDIAPTLLDAAGVDLEKCNIDGVSFKKMFNDVGVEVRDRLLMEMGYARAIKTMEYNYVAVRYPDIPETSLHNNQAGKYYYFKAVDLSSLAAASYANYFHTDQLYDYRQDRYATNNLFRQNPTLDAEYQAMLTEELAKYSNRPFGEFNQ